MSLSMTLNLALIMTILQKHILENYFYHIELVFLPVEVSNFISFIVLYAFPSIIVNYLFIFHKHRYKKLIRKYPNSNGKLSLTYLLISLLLPFVLLFGGLILYHLGFIS
jgi:hypothetical protein